MEKVPERMRTLVLHRFDTREPEVTLEEQPVSGPGAGQVLVRVSASPINPSDVLFLAGHYPTGRTLPTAPGFEGAGLVVAAGDGCEDLAGRRVAFLATADGAWAEFARVDRVLCFPLPDHITDEQGAMLLINPISALGMMQLARDQGATAVVQTAAASALGRMLVRLGKRYGVTTISVVRRAEQAALLRDLGASHVVDTSRDGWEAELAGLAGELNARVAFDAVAGNMTGQVLETMPSGSTVYVYGALSGGEVHVPAGALIFGDKQVRGFWLSHWLGANLANAAWQADLFELAAEDLTSEVAEQVGLDGVVRAIGRYMQGMTRGKVLVVPAR